MHASGQRLMAPPSTWEEDSSVQACHLCGRAFTAINRRHHCRQCGRVVCKHCSSHSVAMTNEAGVIVQGQRCCDLCFREPFRTHKPSWSTPASSLSGSPNGNGRQARTDTTAQEEENGRIASRLSLAEAEADAVKRTSRLSEDESAARLDLVTSEAETFVAVTSKISAAMAKHSASELRRHEITKPGLQLLREGKWQRYEVVDGVPLWTCTPRQGQKRAVKAVFDVAGSYGVTIACLTDQNVTKRFEPLMISTEILPQAPDQPVGVTVSLSKYRTNGIISGRDFATYWAEHSIPVADLAGLEIMSPEGEGERIVRAHCIGAIDNPDQQPSAGFVRGMVHCFGYIVCEMVNDDKEEFVRVVHVAHLDPRGSIPKFAYESTFTDIGRRLAALKAYAEEESLSATQTSKAARSREAACADEDSDSPAVASPIRHADPNALGDAAEEDIDDEGPTKSEQLEEQARLAATAAEASAPKPVRSVDEPPPAITAAKRRVFKLLLDAHQTAPWRMSKTLENCDLEDAVVPYCDKKALRITTTMKATLSTFLSFLDDASMIRKYDASLDKFEVKPSSDPDIRYTYTQGRRETRLIAPRDFSTESTSAILNPKEAKTERLTRGNAVVMLQGARNSDVFPPVKSHTRGVLHFFGYIAVADALDATSIKVYNVMCADPSGKIPNWVIDAAQAASCKKLALIRTLVEERQRTNPSPVMLPSWAPFFPELGPGPTAPAPIEAPAVVSSASPKTTADDTESKDFDSCVGADEFEKEINEMRNFHEEDLNRVIGALTELHTTAKWDAPQVVEGLKVQLAEIKGMPTSASRVVAEFDCTLETFRTIVGDMKTAHKTDPTIETMEVLESPPYGTVVYTAYRSTSRLFTSRDFCTLNCAKVLSEDEGSDAKLYTKGIHSSAVVLSSINSSDMPEQPGYVRGYIKAYGHIAVATPPHAKRIRVFSLASIDPRGKIPGKIIDLAIAETCKKVHKLHELCVAAQIESDAAAAGADVDPSDVCRSIEAPFLTLQTSRAWKPSTQVGDCKVEVMPVPGTPLTGHRLSMEFKCSITTFRAILDDSSTASKVDRTLDVVRVADSRKYPGATHVYTAYKTASRLFSARDFGVVMASRLVPQAEGAKMGLYTEGMRSAAFISASIDSKETAEQPGYVRGSVHAFGYFVLATPPNAKRVRVFQVAAINPGGNIPPKLLTAAITENCAALSRLRVLCEQREKEAAATYREVPEAEVEVEAQEHTDAPADLTDVPTVDEEKEPEEAVEQSLSATMDQGELQHCSVSEVGSPAPLVLSPGYRAIFRPLVEMHIRCTTWKKVKVMHECLIEDTAVNFSDRRAVRLTTALPCSLRTFAKFLASTRMARSYDPTLKTIQRLPSPEEGVITYTSYTQATRLIAPRDFCTLSARVLLRPEDAASAFGINSGGRCTLLSNAVDSSIMPAQRGFVRGRVHLFGFYATAESFDTSPIQVHNVICVDPSGNVPSWVLDVTVGENAKKLAKMRELVRSYHVAMLNVHESSASGGIDAGVDDE